MAYIRIFGMGLKSNLEFYRVVKIISGFQHMLKIRFGLLACLSPTSKPCARAAAPGARAVATHGRAAAALPSVILGPGEAMIPVHTVSIVSSKRTWLSIWVCWWFNRFIFPFSADDVIGPHSGSDDVIVLPKRNCKLTAYTVFIKLIRYGPCVHNPYAFSVAINSNFIGYHFERFSPSPLYILHINIYWWLFLYPRECEFYFLIIIYVTILF